MKITDQWVLSKPKIINRKTLVKVKFDDAVSLTKDQWTFTK